MSGTPFACHVRWVENETARKIHNDEGSLPHTRRGEVHRKPLAEVRQVEGSASRARGIGEEEGIRPAVLPAGRLQFALRPVRADVRVGGAGRPGQAEVL